MIGGAGCRRKGADFEREIVRRLAPVFGQDNVRRGLQSRGGAEVPDVSAPCFWIECKRGRRTNPRAALRQAMVDSDGKGLWPVAICRDDGEPPIVTMDLDDWLDLLTEWHALRQQ